MNKKRNKNRKSTRKMKQNRKKKTQGLLQKGGRQRNKAKTD